MIAITDNNGKTSTTLLVNLLKNLLIKNQSTIGTITTSIIETNIQSISTLTDVRKRKYVISGVRNGASKVFTLVIHTDKATSHLLRYVITLLEVPHGHVHTRITPAKSPASSQNIFHKTNAKSGIIVN